MLHWKITKNHRKSQKVTENHRARALNSFFMSYSSITVTEQM